MNPSIKVHYEPSENLPVKLECNDESLNYPLTVYFTQNASEIWKTQLFIPHTWCELPYGRDVDIKIIDNLGNLIYNKPWVYNSNSDTIEQKFVTWCETFIFNNNFKPKGIVVGAHNGGYGDWVTSFKKDLIGTTLLIEPNIKPFHELVFRFQHDSRFSYSNSVVSEVDGMVNFFTNEYENSESSSLLESEKMTIKKQVHSVNPNRLLENQNIDWLQIDTEGYDAQIILEINDDNLNQVKFIMWEHIHLSSDSKNKIYEKLSNIGYEIFEGLGYNSCAIKKGMV